MDVANVPNELKVLKPLLSCAKAFDPKEPVLAYYCRLAALEEGLKIQNKSQGVLNCLKELMTLVESEKKRLKDREEMGNTTIGCAFVEKYALKLFNDAYQRDLQANITKDLVPLFHHAAALIHTAIILGGSNEELERAQRYARWKCVYINQCLKNGQTPIPGPAAAEGEDLELPSNLMQQPASGPSPPSAAAQGPFSPGAAPGGASAPQTPSSCPTASKPFLSEPPRNPQIPEGGTEADTEMEGIPVELFKNVDRLLRIARSALYQNNKEQLIQYLQESLNLLHK